MGPILITTLNMCQVSNAFTATMKTPVKLLGIFLDANLNFNPNTTALSNKLSQAIFFINRVNPLLDGPRSNRP